MRLLLQSVNAFGLFQVNVLEHTCAYALWAHICICTVFCLEVCHLIKTQVTKEYMASTSASIESAEVIYRVLLTTTLICEILID